MFGPACLNGFENGMRCEDCIVGCWDGELFEDDGNRTVDFVEQEESHAPLFDDIWDVDIEIALEQHSPPFGDTTESAVGLMGCLVVILEEKNRLCLSQSVCLLLCSKNSSVHTNLALILLFTSKEIAKSKQRRFRVKTKQRKKETECDEKTPPLSSSSSNIPSTQAGGCIRDVLCSADNTETEFHHNPLRDTPISLSVQLKEKPIPCQVSFLSVSFVLLTAENPSTSLPEPVCCGVCVCVSSQDIQTGKTGVETTGAVLQLGVNRGGEGSSGEGSHSLICFVCPELHKLLSENKTKQADLMRVSEVF